MTIKKKATKTYGEMLKNKMFNELVSELSDLKQHAPEVFKKYSDPKEDGAFSDLTMLFYYLPQYSSKMIQLDITQRPREELEEFEHEGVKAFRDINHNYYTVDANDAIDVVEQKNPVFIKSKTELADGVKELFNFLVDNDAQVEIYFSNEYGKNALFKACEDATPSYIEMLLNTGKINLFVEDGAGRDALYYAAAQERLDIMDYLVNEKGFDVNKQMLLEDNQTLLHMVCKNAMDDEVFSVIDKLIEMKADLTLEDFSGMKPHEYLQEMIEDEGHRFSEVPEILEQGKQYLAMMQERVQALEEESHQQKPKYQTSF